MPHYLHQKHETEHESFPPGKLKAFGSCATIAVKLQARSAPSSRSRSSPRRAAATWTSAGSGSAAPDEEDALHLRRCDAGEAKGRRTSFQPGPCPFWQRRAAMAPRHDGRKLKPAQKQTARGALCVSVCSDVSEAQMINGAELLVSKLTTRLTEKPDSFYAA